MSSFLVFRCFTESLMSRIIIQPTLSSYRYRRAKHWNPKYKKERGEKVVKITLPDFDEERQNEKLSLEQIRAKLKEKGICPPRSWNERPMHISCTGDILDPFVPPEGDGKISLVSSPGMKQLYDVAGKKGKSYMALRKIRNIDYEFDVPSVAEKANEIYVEAQKALAEQDEDKLHDLVTEKAYKEMTENTKNKTIRWKLIQSLEPSRIVHIRCEELVSKENLFAQVTVRMHTQQTLAIYDRFGRLMHGSEDECKDVLEYVVLEKHINDTHGIWRIHGKIIPDWMPPKAPIKKTYCKPNIDEEFPEPPPKAKDSSKETSDEKSSALATA